MKPSYPHAAPPKSTSESITVVGGPPSRDSTLTAVLLRGGTPGTMNPRREPSGEKNGLTAPSVPPNGDPRSWSRAGSHNRVPPSGVAPVYPGRSPPGEIASRYMSNGASP